MMKMPWLCEWEGKAAAGSSRRRERNAMRKKNVNVADARRQARALKFKRPDVENLPGKRSVLPHSIL